MAYTLKWMEKGNVSKTGPAGSYTYGPKGGRATKWQKKKYGEKKLRETSKHET